MKEDSVILRRQPLVLLGSVMVAGILLCTPYSDVRAQGRPSGLVRHTPSGVEIKTDACVLAIRPINPSAMRVRCAKDMASESPSIVLLKPSSVPAFKVSEDAASVVVATSQMQAVFDRRSGALHFTDHSGKTFLSEIAGTRRLAPATVQGETTFAVEQDFISPPDEHLFGSGEFQDGFLDIRDLPRRLTQVNSQIAIPFLLSSKGYGILWHNYGLTDLNPANELVLLARSSTGKETTANVTTSEGARREVQRESEFGGSMEIPRSGRYAFMLDVGQKMARRYHVEIDGKVVIDFSNFWLPPTTSWFSDVSSGHHTIRVIGEQDDQPVLSGGRAKTAPYYDLPWRTRSITSSSLDQLPMM